MVKSSAKHHKGNVLCNILCYIMRDEIGGREGRGWLCFTLTDLADCE